MKEAIETKIASKTLKLLQYITLILNLGLPDAESFAAIGLTHERCTAAENSANKKTGHL